MNPKPLALPSTVNIGPHTYRLVRTEEADANQQWAFTSFTRRLIGFGFLCNEREMPSSLMHELVHATASAYGVELEHKGVEALANGLTQALQSLGLLPDTLCLEGESKDV